MSVVLLVITVVVFACAGSSVAAAEKTAVELRSKLLVTGLPMAESDKAIYGIRLTAQVDKDGEGTGTIELDPNAPAYDEFGFQTTARMLPLVKLDCTLKLVKRKKLRMPESERIAAPLVELEYVLFEIRGPKVTSRRATSCIRSTS